MQDVTSKISQPTSVIITISLTRGPVCNEYSLIKLLETIERHIFKDCKWQLKNDTRDSIVVRYTQLHVYKQPVVFSYKLENIEEITLEDLKTEIVNTPITIPLKSRIKS